ncbi:hypothetical protein N7495_006619 [Penicillium taxi]|uniref:uncharacterized protein n=1 Tax=Penicillium taxi TaxID=168475 RepID=UPI0025452B83|nr:uncharacterized protein N7495_006619 [Penicillium taxi]KAJ5894928.1 hypothetical protein N7495_006619 [Penicillium taxi]
MSSSYTNEPNPTASATLHTTIGPIQISLFANQAPLTCKSFLQHCKDNYYAGTVFHRVVPDFVIQGGDPSGTGSGGTSIYEYPEFEYDPEARDPTERVVLQDEIHSRLRFNRRGLVGMAKSEDGSYGSQFFITLANTEAEMNGQCTMFGRLEGDSIFNVLKIADADRIEGTERPVYPVKVTSCEVGELGPLAGKLKDRMSASSIAMPSEKQAPKKKKKAGKGRTLLSFGDEGDEDMPIRPAKPKYNATLVTDAPGATMEVQKTSKSQPTESQQPRKRPRSPSPQRSPSAERRKRPKSPDPVSQLPLQNLESPSRSPSPPPKNESKLSRTNAEIESLMASMRRTVDTGPSDTGKKKSAIEEMMPSTATRARRRPPPGSANSGGTAPKNSAESEALRMFNAFKAKLQSADATKNVSSKSGKEVTHKPEQVEDEEEQLCDLHFIVNCQSCKSWDDDETAATDDHNDDDKGWLSHQLRFGKDTLGKDLKWKQDHRDDLDTLMVVDPREKEKELVGTGRRRVGLERDRERERKLQHAGNMEWDREKSR